ncbi:MAG: hypothetical protein KAR17_01065 [Cyclobacteriaceae bacterium]|nr:hypothetical protein [Cyclobacteriaceae bacterium]MCK5281622.1 hypothetical protein [Cyclobacteriaceae bacterium]
MKIIRHRRNTIQELQETSQELGIEVDLRSYGNDLIIHHEPFDRGELFTNWLKYFRHGMLILNVKEEGLENRLLIEMEKHNIEDFFFLDQSFPFLIKTAKSGESRCAVRVSEYESIDTALSLAGLIDWVWVDCFTGFPLNQASAQQLKKAGFKLCLVSPELQGRIASSEIVAMRKKLEKENIEVDAVCTKYPEQWQ